MGAAQFGSTFFMITGFHGLHVSVGVLFLILVARKVWRGDYDTNKPTTEMGRVRLSIELCTNYWHFLLLVWLVMFGLMLGT